MFCTKCGNKIVEGAAFCQKCGTKVTQAVKGSVQQISVVPNLTADIPASTNGQSFIGTGQVNNDFREFVDNHVRTTTKFQSAEDLLKNSKPLLFILPCICIFAILGLIAGGPLGMLIIGGFFGYTAVFIASGIIRMKYRAKYKGEFIGDININDLVIFLDKHLKHIHPDFHEWGYLSNKGGLLSILENAIVNATEEVRICSEFGPKRKSLVAFYIKPKTSDAKPGEKLYFVDAQKNGFLKPSGKR